MLRDSTAVAVALVRTRPRAIPLATITMRKLLHGLPLIPYMVTELRLAVLLASGAPLLKISNEQLDYELEISIV